MRSLIMRLSIQVLLATMLSAVWNPAVAQPDSRRPKSSQGAQWSEYVYSDDGFAAKFPYSPNAHKDTQVPDGAVYTLSLAGFTLTLHVANYPEGCSERFTRYVGIVRKTSKQLQDGTIEAAQGGFRVDPTTIREIIVAGYPAVEHEQEVISSKLKNYERWQCVGTRLYIFSAHWPQEQPKPPDVTRIVSSFRLVSK
jgi:hypothetical protein